MPTYQWPDDNAADNAAVRISALLDEADCIASELSNYRVEERVREAIDQARNALKEL